jgi:hypothetical protein
MSNDLKRFIQQLDDMLTKLKHICPDNKDLKVYYHKFDMVRNLNSQLIICSFIKYVYPYREYITDDIDKFEEFVNGVNLHQEINKNKDLINEISDFTKEDVNNELVINKALDLKNIWENNLNDENKNVLFTYFRVLIKLCDRYIASKAK